MKEFWEVGCNDWFKWHGFTPNPHVHDDDPVPSTSGVNTKAASNRVNDSSILNTSTSLDEQDFGTQNKDYLESEIHVEVIESSSMSSDTLPDLEITFKDESSDNEQGVTVFRAINQDDSKKTRRRSRRGKFETVDVASSFSDSE